MEQLPGGQESCCFIALPQRSGSLLTPKQARVSARDDLLRRARSKEQNRAVHAHAYPFRCSRQDIHGKLSSPGTGFQELLLLWRVFDETVHRENQMIGCA